MSDLIDDISESVILCYFWNFWRRQMNKNNGVAIYLAMPIDASLKIASKRYKKVAREIGNHLDTIDVPSTIFLPGRAYAISGCPSSGRDAYVIGINDFALEEADIMVVLYTPNIESWGVPQEVDKAWRANIPVIAFVENLEVFSRDKNQLPMYLRNKLKAYAMGYLELAKTIKDISDEQRAPGFAMVPK